MLSEEQAHELKVFIWTELPIEIVKNLPHDIINEFNKVIDKAITQTTETKDS